MQGLCLVAGGTVQALVVLEAWNSHLVQVTLQQRCLESEGDVDDSQWQLIGAFHCPCLDGRSASSMIVSGMEAEPELLCIGGRSVHDIALLGKNTVDAKSRTFASSPRSVGLGPTLGGPGPTLGGPEPFPRWARTHARWAWTHAWWAWTHAWWVCDLGPSSVGLDPGLVMMCPWSGRHFSS